MANRLDTLGRRYSTRPSSLMGFHPSDGRALLYDLAILKGIEKKQIWLQTTEGKIMSERERWDRETIREYKEMGLWPSEEM